MTEGAPSVAEPAGERMGEAGTGAKRAGRLHVLISIFVVEKKIFAW
jgi:hypothetical protein